ncbi:hypothetical protein BJX64DRAFT_28597 [Aspergillus heterothallicus]
MEYWGDQEKRLKYLMANSIARAELKDTLVVLEAKAVSKKFIFGESNAKKRPAPDGLEFIPEERKSSGEDDNAIGPDNEAHTDLRADNIRDEEETEGETTPSQVFLPMSQNMSMTEADPMPVALSNITTATTTRRVRRRTTVTTDMEHRMTPPSKAGSSASSTCTSTSRGPSKTSTFSLIDVSLARAMYAKYHHDTFFLITTDGSCATAAAWHEYKDFSTASSFLLDMGRARGLEHRWWTAEAQMMIDGENGHSQADYTLAAKDVIIEASITLEWSGEEILVHWDNDADWNVVRQMVYKAWTSREFGFQMIGVFKVKVLLHLHVSC